MRCLTSEAGWPLKSAGSEWEGNAQAMLETLRWGLCGRHWAGGGRRDISRIAGYEGDLADGEMKVKSLAVGWKWSGLVGGG